MRALLRQLFAILLFVGALQSASAQYYSWGADRAALKWNMLKTDSVRVIYPDNVDHIARSLLHYYDSAKSSESFGFTYPGLKVPFVVHPENFVSNGMVMWAPLRVEFLSTPAVDGYSMPWIKQLVAHEYRHAVQYDNLDRSTLKAISYLLGEQGAAASLLFPPLYALEGDAVMLETQVSTYGRGLQPSFSIGYRALADEFYDHSFLMWRCGSYLRAVPDHYRMGYQMMSYAYDKFGENILDKVFAYTARNPQFISPYSIALRKYYDTSTYELFCETFNSLIEFWAPLAQVENSSEQISRVDKRNFTTYSHPRVLEDGRLLALKTDYSDPSRFVIFDPQESTEEVVAHTGYISTYGGYAAGRVWWTEYRRSPLFAEDYNSQLCYMELENGRTKRLRGHKNALYPTPIGASKEHIAYVEYDPSGQYTVVELDGAKTIGRTEVTYPNEVHSMAWDEVTERLYIIVTGDKGMWIERQGDDGFEPITEPAYITISNLTASDGTLYFGSIASGKDEVHSLELSSGIERQLSESTYGSFNPAAGGGELYMTTYDKYGYHLARQSAASVVGERNYSLTPQTVVNPERAKWDVINLDTVLFDAPALQRSLSEHQAARYRKASHMLNFHSWAPIYYDPFTLLSEMSLDIGLGVTAVSQNLLSSCEAFVAYGWDHYQGSILKGGLKYDGWGVNLSLLATYGGEQNAYLLDSESLAAAGYSLKNYNEVSLSATLPLYFSSGYHNHMLSIYGGWSYSNGIVPEGLTYRYDVDVFTQQRSLIIGCEGWSEGLNKLSAGVSYTNYVISALRDLTTPLGYSLSASYALDPFNSEFSHLFALYGKLYTPGFAKNNSLTFAAAYQTAIDGFEIEGYHPLSYLSTALIPHGFSSADISNNNYLAASASYQFPLCYPEFDAFWKKLYVKRLALGLGADYAQFTTYPNSSQSIYSYGLDFIVDLNAISMSSASTLTTTFSLYKPEQRSLYFQLGVSLPF